MGRTPALVLAALLCVHPAAPFRIEGGAGAGSQETDEGGQPPVFVEVNSENSLGEDAGEDVRIKSVIPVLKQGLQQVGA